MSITLDDLTLRLTAAQQRLAEADQRLKHAQQIQAYASYEVSTWTAAVNIEKNREEARQKAASIPATTSVSGNATPTQAEIPAKQSASEAAQPHESQEVNKTEMIRDLLRQNPTGLTPSDLWKRVKAQFTHRPYLYSVLKRLKDRDEVTVKRGKYLLKTIQKVEEQKPNSTVVQ